MKPLPTADLQALAVEKFLRYVAVDTQSKEDVEAIPSTEKQKNLSRMLEKELQALGLTEVKLDSHGYVYGTLPARGPGSAEVPPVAFIAHVDTSPAVSGENVKAIVHKNYQGGDIVLPGDPTRVITVEKNIRLKKEIGHDVITTDGTTLLGADDKAGVAEIMAALEFLQKNPDIAHGTIKVGFTPDEEVGRGADKFDIKGLGAKYAYTVDGEQEGELNDETFNAASATVVFHGKSAHPGYAKNKMVNSFYAVAHFLNQFANLPRPEITEGREGYFHPYTLSGSEEKTVIKVLLRDFDLPEIATRKKKITELVERTQKAFPETKLELSFTDSYKNMREVLKDYPFIADFSEEAMKRAGLTPLKLPIRGGTDGARLSFQDLPTANIFTGCENAHSREEWVSAHTMAKSVETILHLTQIWLEKGPALKKA